MRKRTRFSPDPTGRHGFIRSEKRDRPGVSRPVLLEQDFELFELFFRQAAAEQLEAQAGAAGAGLGGLPVEEIDPRQVAEGRDQLL